MAEQSYGVQAAFHIVRRVQDDPDFAWKMIGTESLRLCMLAVAEERGEMLETVRKVIETNARSSIETRGVELLRLREQVEELKSRLIGEYTPRDLEEQESDWKVTFAIEKIIHLAHCGHQVLTVDMLQQAICNPARV